MAAKKIVYDARNFESIRRSLLDFVKENYPEASTSLGDASIGLMLLELNAAVGDMLSYHTDRMFQETQLEFAQERKSILAIAKTLGFKIPGKRPAVTICNFTIKIPPKQDSYDDAYLPVLRAGSQATGGGKIFELTTDVDFSSPFSNSGLPNRTINPIRDSSNTVLYYEISKQEIVTAGETIIFKKVVTREDYVPFLEVFLPESNVISVEQIITIEGSNITRTPSINDFLNEELRWYEVDSLGETHVFTQNLTQTSDREGVIPADWRRVTKKFTSEFTDKGFCKITFGSGDPERGNLYEEGQSVAYVLFNNSLGEIPKIGNTLFIRYRIGGGVTSNIGPNVLTSIGKVDMQVNGPSAEENKRVKQSLSVNNPIPALGGGDQMSIEQIRKTISYNFAAQGRAVTVRDYIAQLSKMPGKFGTPFKLRATEKDNKVSFYVLYLDENRKLTNTSTNTLKSNMAAYLYYFRMINDYIEIRDGRIVNLGFEIDLLRDKSFNETEIIAEAINTVADFMSVDNKDMGESLYLGALIEQLNNITGVINVLDVRVFCKVGGKYSLNETNQAYVDNTTKQIKLIDYSLFAEQDSMFEVKYPETDIKVRTK